MAVKENITHNKILIINLGGIGDILLSTPALRALKNNSPTTQISILVIPRDYEILKDLSYIDNIFIFHKGYSPVGFFKSLNTLLTLRGMHFDLAINMRTLVSKRSTKKIKFLLDIIKPKIKAGRDTEGRGYFFDINIPETDIGTKYEMEYDIDTIKALDIEVIDKNIDFKIDKFALEEVNQLLGKEGVSADDILVGIHPGGVPSRRWPIENFSEIIDTIYKERPAKFVITGGKKEVNLAKRLVKMANAKIINFAGRLSIKELGVLIKRCNLYISNDTGPMHIAAILNTPLVAIFGPGDITRYDPRNISNKTVVLYQKVVCAPCNKVKCDSMECLKLISSEEVVEAVLKLLLRSS